MPVDVKAYHQNRNRLIRLGEWASRPRKVPLIDWKNQKARADYRRAYKRQHPSKREIDRRAYYSIRRVLRAYVDEYIAHDREYQQRYHRERCLRDPAFREMKLRCAQLANLKNKMRACQQT